MNRSAAPTARAQDEPADIDEDEGDEDKNDGSDEDTDSPARPIHVYTKLSFKVDALRPPLQWRRGWE